MGQNIFQHTVPMIALVPYIIMLFAVCIKFSCLSLSFFHSLNTNVLSWLWDYSLTTMGYVCELTRFHLSFCCFNTVWKLNWFLSTLLHQSTIVLFCYNCSDVKFAVTIIYFLVTFKVTCHLFYWHSYLWDFSNCSLEYLMKKTEK